MGGRYDFHPWRTSILIGAVIALTSADDGRQAAFYPPDLSFYSADRIDIPSRDRGMGRQYTGADDTPGHPGSSVLCLLRDPVPHPGPQQESRVLLYGDHRFFLLRLRGQSHGDRAQVPDGRRRAAQSDTVRPSDPAGGHTEPSGRSAFLHGR